MFHLPRPSEERDPEDGTYPKKVLLLSDALEKEEEDLQYARKIMEAVHLSLNEDIHMVITPRRDLRLSDLVRNREVEKVLVFGHSGPDLGLRFRYRPYRPVRMGGVSYLFADPLPRLREERAKGKTERAKRLWKALQRMFSLA